MARIGGRYELGRTLGTGGMGEVRLAWDTRLARSVAIKTLRPLLAADPAMRRRFETEGRTAAKVTHPNVVQVYDCGEDNGVPFLVMEYVEGSTLAEEIARGPIEPARARRIALGVARGLGAAHAQGITHCDVKPANIVLVDDEPKVTDFGIAKTVDGLSAETTGLLLGTPAYVAPERSTGGPATPAGDVYSAGIVMAEMLTGERSAEGEFGSVDPELASIIRRATHASPDRRFADGDELAAALAEDRGVVTTELRPSDDATLADAATVAFAPPPTRAPAPSTQAPGNHAPRRARWLLPVVAVLLVALSIGAALATGLFDSGEGTSPTSPAVEVPEVTTAPTVATIAPTRPSPSVPVVVSPGKAGPATKTTKAPKPTKVKAEPQKK